MGLLELSLLGEVLGLAQKLCLALLLNLQGRGRPPLVEDLLLQILVLLDQRVQADLERTLLFQGGADLAGHGLAVQLAHGVLELHHLILDLVQLHSSVLLELKLLLFKLQLQFLTLAVVLLVDLLNLSILNLREVVELLIQNAEFC